MFQTFLTGLREGLEAALVIGIIVAYLVRSDRRSRLPAVWAGVGAAMTLCLGVGAALTFTSKSLSDKAEEGFAGVMSIVAVALVTWMVFWMRSTAHHLKGDLQGRIDTAVAMGSGALAFAAFVAVGREGLETALFLWPTIRSGGAGASFGAILGLVVAAVLGFLLYKRSVHLDLAKFFRWTGIALVVIAAGVLLYGIHELQEAGFIPGEDAVAFDVSNTISPTGWLGSLLKGTINFNPRTTWLALVAWLGYLVPVMALFLRPQRADKGVATRPADGPRRDSENNLDHQSVGR
jgi:high-affinity iron transporter